MMGSVTESYSRENQGLRSQVQGLRKTWDQALVQFASPARIHYSGAHSSLAAVADGFGSRSEISASAASFFASSGRNESAPKRQRQFPISRLGTFMRASLPNPSASCIGTTQRLATELEAARIIAQLMPSSHRPRYASTCWRSYAVAPNSHQPSNVSLSCVPVYTTFSVVKVCGKWAWAP